MCANGNEYDLFALPHKQIANKLYAVLYTFKIMGKAKKRLKNIEAKVKKRKAKEKKFIDSIKNMDDERSYRVELDNGDYLLQGVFLKGRIWKKYYISD